MSINKVWFIINYIFRNSVVSFTNNPSSNKTKRPQQSTKQSSLLHIECLNGDKSEYVFIFWLCQIQTKFLRCITCASSSSDSLEVSHGFLQMSRAQPAASSKDFVCTLAREAGWAEEQDTDRITLSFLTFNFTVSKRYSYDIPNRILWIQPTLCKLSTQTAEY